MERESDAVKARCRSGCGFYGNPATDGLCSICYKNTLKKKQEPPATASTPTATTNNSAITNSSSNAASSNGQAPDNVLPSISTRTGQTTIPCLEKENNVDEPTCAEASSEALSDKPNSFDNKDSEKDSKKKKNRCTTCRKKVGLTGFECRCGGLFCAVHRYSDKHDCGFDYRELGAQEIRRNNPVVVGEKIKKI
uniref:Putative an1-type zinc finger protein 5 n=1 Tax=Xenopsylla cheopis TaxID=163159 RepID=A0A6M2DF93_XENCH